MSAREWFEWQSDNAWLNTVQGPHLASIPAPEIEAWGLEGLAYFCGECGTVWARQWLETPQKPRPDYWHVRIQSCRKHGNGSLVNPLMEFSGFVQRGDRAPRELLLWEFLCATDSGPTGHGRKSEPLGGAMPPSTNNEESVNALLPDR